jgi:hypothetical protein
MKRWPDIKAQVIQRGEDGGAWVMDSPTNGDLIRIIASVGAGWDHVSVSLARRTPTWDEMEMVKRTFFKDDETAIQFHVPPLAHINIHPNCLHIWRPHHIEIPLPPGWMV